MNDFTKEELERILDGITWWLDGDDALYCEQLIDKIQTMIDNYDSFNPNEIAKAHLKEACSLISHAMDLLEMNNNE